MNAVLNEIITLLDVEPIEENLFRGQNHNTEHVFGGQVLAQALASAFRTVDSAQPLHSLHSYFLRPGDWTRPILYEVDRPVLLMAKIRRRLKSFTANARRASARSFTR